MRRRTSASGRPAGSEDIGVNTERPNVVFVLTDDQGYGDLSCHGNPIVKTPHIDALYSVSVRLTDYHVGPTCAPTRAGLLTGHYANSTGVWRTSGGRSLLRADEVSMADYFRRNGYATGIFGKWHLGDNAPYRPQDRGFETVVVHGGGGVGQTPDFWGNSYFDDSYWDGQQFRQFEGYCTDVWFQQALEFIERNRHRPFFCFIPNTTTALLLAEDRKSKKRRRSGCIGAVHSVPWLFRMRFRTLIFARKTADS